LALDKLKDVLQVCLDTTDLLKEDESYGRMAGSLDLDTSSMVRYKSPKTSRNHERGDTLVDGVGECISAGDIS
jgi:hypothetical protein